MELFKNCKIYAPERLQETQVLTADGKILAVGDRLSVRGCAVKVIDLKGRYLCPGFIDQHVHVTGGGGQFGYASFIPEVTKAELAATGTTTVVGLLGTDGFVKELSTLYAKVKALDAEGLTPYSQNFRRIFNSALE